MAEKRKKIDEVPPYIEVNRKIKNAVLHGYFLIPKTLTEPFPYNKLFFNPFQVNIFLKHHKTTEFMLFSGVKKGNIWLKIKNIS